MDSLWLLSLALVAACGTFAGAKPTNDDSTSVVGAGACQPPDTLDVDGVCVPSCGAAGGNVCVDSASTLCEGLPALDSYDCAVCCARPSYPAPALGSMHFVYQSSPAFWDAILGMTQTNANVLFVSQVKPAQVSPDRWVAYLTYRSTPRPTAADVNQLLIDPATAPRLVMFEELHDATSQAYFVALADELRTRYPQWAGRWGVFLTFGNYPVLAPGIDAILRADAVVALELYPTKMSYCASSTTVGGRDIWLSEQFIGNATFGRLDWLIARRTHDGSHSQITPVFGVGDILLGDVNAAIFMDRMFYVWATRTGHRDLILAANGGPGAYKWQSAVAAPGGYGVTSTARDDQFAQSFAHYSVTGATSSRLGQVACP